MIIFPLPPVYPIPEKLNQPVKLKDLSSVSDHNISTRKAETPTSQRSRYSVLDSYREEHHV
jgi:hypothetical protein